ncbi:site-specific integrase [Oxalobacteraceae bacterium OTU3REALA1]|nr:site-specific integrase [Oxalobacteraceae bacterium OTU3REALA1]
MNSSNRGLYTALKNIDIPDSVSVFGGARHIHFLRIRETAFVRWPCGAPCLPINMYLLDCACEWTGESALTYASQLTVLVRYCYDTKKAFGDLADGDISKFVEILTKHGNVHAPNRKTRNNNTVREILQRSLHFLDWYQKHLLRSPFVLLGEESQAAAITCKRARNSRNGETYWQHRYAPQSEATCRKLPIPYSVIEDVEAAVEEIADGKNRSEPCTRRYAADPAFQAAICSYLYDRRLFMIWLMKRTGLRPAEMMGMSLTDNVASLAKRMLTLYTKKRRRKNDPVRHFPITEKDVRVILRYFDARKRWKYACLKRGVAYDLGDSLFLSTAARNYGADVSISALEKDFGKLCRVAGYEDYRVCFSMFRHRFITDEVRAHLRQWEAQNGALVIDQDYRALLERVRVKTGHASVESLWHYIDIAQETEGLWVPIDNAIERDRAYRDIQSELRQVRRDLAGDGTRKLSAADRLKRALSSLDSLTAEAGTGGVELSSSLLHKRSTRRVSR